MNLSPSSSARLLLWASASFAFVIAAMLAAAFVYQSRTGDSSAPVTQADIDLAQPWYTLLGYALLLPIVLGAVASIGLARTAPRPRLAPGVTAVWVAAVIAGIGYAVAWHSSMHFGESAYSDSAAAVAATWLVRGGLVPLAYAATGLLAYQLGARLIVGVCAVLIAVSVTSAALGIDLPPALLVAAWIPLGVRALRARPRLSSEPVES